MGDSFDWKAFIAEVLRKNGYDKPARFGSPAPEASLQRLRDYCGGRAPEEISALLAQINGVHYPGGGWFIFDIDEMIVTNNSVREPWFAERREPLDSILFFAEPGTGDYFGYDLSNFQFPIIGWEQVPDTRTWKAANLRDFIAGWFCGEVTA